VPPRPNRSRRPMARPGSTCRRPGKRRPVARPPEPLQPACSSSSHPHFGAKPPRGAARSARQRRPSLRWRRRARWKTARVSKGTRAMSVAVSTAAPARSLQGPELKQLLHQLRKTDNLTNWLYILRTYIYLVLVIGAAVWFFASQPEWG